MKALKTTRHDRFSFALGAVSAVSSFAVMPVVANDRITAAWDRKLRERAAKPGVEGRQDAPQLSLAT